MNTIYVKQMGTERQNGTDFPIDAVVYKAGERCWVYGLLVNKVMRQAAERRTKRDAIDSARELET